MAIIVILVILIIIWVAVVYNKALSWRMKVENSLSQIDVQLKTKAELIPNLVEVTRRYAEHELEIFERTTVARSQMLGAMTTVDAVKVDSELTMYIDKIFALSESYPDLKSDALFLDLQRQIREIEDKIAMYRQFYNDTVMLNNRYIQTFPNIIIARLFGFKGKEYLRFDTEG